MTAPEPFYDRKDQHERIAQLLVPGESLLMTLDCKGSGTGFVGITTRRIVFQDQSWRKSRNVLVSVPYDRVHAVGLSATANFLGRTSGQLSIQAGEDDWMFEFKNADKVRAAYMTIMAYTLNRETNTPDTPIPALSEA